MMTPTITRMQNSSVSVLVKRLRYSLQREGLSWGGSRRTPNQCLQGGYARGLQHHPADAGHGAQAVGRVLNWERLVLKAKGPWGLPAGSPAQSQPCLEPEGFLTPLLQPLQAPQPHSPLRQIWWWHC